MRDSDGNQIGLASVYVLCGCVYEGNPQSIAHLDHSPSLGAPLSMAPTFPDRHERPYQSMQAPPPMLRREHYRGGGEACLRQGVHLLPLI